MKKKGVYFGALITLIFGIMIFSCEEDSPSQDLPSFAEAKGKLTVTGIDEFNNNYVYISGMAGSNVLTGLTDITGFPSNITYKLAKVANGKAEIPLYMVNPNASSYSNSYIAYDGNDTVTLLSIYILNEETLDISNASNVMLNNIEHKILKSGTFANGNMSIDWNELGGSWTPSGTAPIQLTEDTWVSGSISSSGGQQWFTFDATASTQYIHVTFGTLTDLYVEVYDSNGNINWHQNLYGSTRYTSCSITSGQKYFIKVYPYSSSGYGTYQIAFNTSSSAPSGGSSGGSWTPGYTTTQLTVSQWSSGSISSSSGQQWFAFDATASTQYIHVTFGTLTDLYVEVYNSNGNTVGSRTNLYGSTRYTSRSLTSGQKYYIKVTPYSGSGSFQIAFNTSNSAPSGSGGSWTPGYTTTQLTVSQWSSGNISSSGGQQWFTFNATASTQYIHVTFGTLTDMYVEVYDSNGNMIGYQNNLWTSNRYTSRSLTSGQKYYIKVYPYSGSGYGTYQIAFNTSSSAPSGGNSGGGGISICTTHVFGPWQYTTVGGSVTVRTRACTICSWTEFEQL